MVTLTNVRALAALSAVGEMLRVEFPNARGPYRLYKLQAELEGAIGAFTQARDRIFNQYGKLDETGRVVTTHEDGGVRIQLKDTTPETAQAFKEQFAALLAEEVEIHTALPLALLDGAPMKGEWFVALGALVVDE
jgi:hypothetical protein